MYSEYDRVSDVIYQISNELTLQFNVVFSYKSKDGKRVFYHTESQYNSKYLGTDIAKSIKRYMRYYYTINIKDDFFNGFVLKVQDVYMLLDSIEKRFLPLYFDNKKRIFSVIDKKLIIKGDISPYVYQPNDYSYLRLTPIVLSYSDDSYKEGVRFEVNDPNYYTDITIDTFLGFYYTLKNTDMYGAACSICNYALNQPDEGINVYKPKQATGLGSGGGNRYPEGPELPNVDDNKNKGKKNNFLDNAKKKEGNNK